MKIKRFPLILKIFIIHLNFLLLHYLFDWFPNNLTATISGINESVYQHMKIGFFAYSLFAIIEYLATRKSIVVIDQFFYSKLFSASYLPLVMMVIYLLGPLSFGRSESILFEIIFANIALLLTSFITLTVEMQIKSAKPSLVFRSVSIFLFILSMVQYVVFTYELPWFDIFANPPGY